MSFAAHAIQAEASAEQDGVSMTSRRRDDSVVVRLHKLQSGQEYSDMRRAKHQTSLVMSPPNASAATLHQEV